MGSDVEVVVFRDGEEVTLTVTLGQRETAQGEGTAEPPAPAEPMVEEFLGMTLEPLTDALREELGLASDASGLVVRDVTSGSDADQKGVRPGDLITEAGQSPVSTIAELQERAENARDAGRRSLLVLLRRDGDPRFVALNIEGE